MLLFIHNSRSDFVMRDLATLSEHGRVNRFFYTPSRGVVANLVQQFRLLAWLLYWIPRSRGVFCWFADLHSLLPVLFARMLGKPSWVVLGGYDVASIPEYGYGVFSNPVRGFFARWTMQLAGLCLPVSAHTSGEAAKRCPGVRLEVLHNAVEAPGADIGASRSGLVVTVAVIDRRSRVEIKGIDRFLAVARLVPELRFAVVGVEPHHRHLLPTVPDHVELVPPMPGPTLHQYLSTASVYCQFSRSESFGIAAVEAALCGAVPVVTEVGALPEVMGSGALYWDGADPADAARMIREAAGRPPDPVYIDCLRDRFDPAKRRRRLLELTGGIR